MHQKRGLPCPRAFKILTGYNGFRGSICVTNGYYGTHPTHSYEHVDMRESLLRGLLKAKPYECLSNISHDFQTYA